ncbi:hypothetical protein GCM10017771_31240 [Streptomyces capitiformicae]|uniref:Uncharacterized protein n=1 Tax=Streptomyces capitiformicae TaxID=2014920 RepID=A0A919GNR5_9ACTN|nr:hypothetical protein GCM10017771_31240 [Streptomyces capitiformicae]
MSTAGHQPADRSAGGKEVTDLSRHTREELDTVAAELIGRPRKTLGRETPAERLSKPLAA